MNRDYLDTFIKAVIREDIGDGDHSSLACIHETAIGKAILFSKEQGILAGVKIGDKIFHKIDPGLKIECCYEDGVSINAGDIIYIIEGKILSILLAERIVLNVLQRMCGIATQTRAYTEKLRGLKAKVLDTRKTTPGMRFLDKLAVRIGGGENHRMGLYDMILLKDNHIEYAGGIEKAIKSANQYLKEKGKNLKIEIEAQSLKDVKGILKIGGVHRIMLDNFSIEDTKKAVTLINGKYEVESSGGITLETVRQFAECGVDFVSVGALTHHIKSIDLSLKAIIEE
ncbi:MAG: carboxylating nicotinate-nucleotide diphosphorylase [Bacteroidetes bacterium]|nr:carboxylating nicotinate-nucleotide diphosphorylase [Bacteroidota bacterium]